MGGKREEWPATGEERLLTGDWWPATGGPHPRRDTINRARFGLVAAASCPEPAEGSEAGVVLLQRGMTRHSAPCF